jgi:hypothetical protein
MAETILQKISVLGQGTDADAATRPLIEIRDLSLFYGANKAPCHGLHRAVRLRQVHLAALPQPHE